MNADMLSSEALAIAIPFLLLSLVLGTAIVTDLRARRIPNNLILAGWALAFGWHLFAPAGRWVFDAVSPGAVGLLGSVVAAAVLLVAFLPLYAARIMGAGDVKLMSIVGGFFGMTTQAWGQLLGVALVVLATGGALAVARMAFSRRSAAVLANLHLIFYGYTARMTSGAAPVFDARVDSADRMPYAIAIAVGTLVYIIGKQLGWISLL